MRVRFPAAALVVACASVGVARADHRSPWDEVTNPHRRRCARLLDEATKLLKARRGQAATQSALAVGTLCSSDPLVLQQAGEILLAAGDAGDARLLLEQSRALGSGTAATPDRELTLAYALGVARQKTGDLQGAIEEHRRAEALGGLRPPNQYLVHATLGDELMGAGRLSESIDEYRRAVALAPPTNTSVRLAMAVALDRDEQVDRARAELDAILAVDPQLGVLAGDASATVPPEDRDYYRAIALWERGATAEMRVALRKFVAELPTSPYIVHARQRLAEAEHHIDAREIESSAAGLDRQAVARALSPVVGDLEACLPEQRVVELALVVGDGRIASEPSQPAADCLNPVLSRMDAGALRRVGRGTIRLRLAGRRGAASAP